MLCIQLKVVKGEIDLIIGKTVDSEERRRILSPTEAYTHYAIAFRYLKDSEQVVLSRSFHPQGYESVETL